MIEPKNGLFTYVSLYGRMLIERNISLCSSLETKHRPGSSQSDHIFKCNMG